jgi:hypothetical protein
LSYSHALGLLLGPSLGPVLHSRLLCLRSLLLNLGLLLCDLGPLLIYLILSLLLHELTLLSSRVSVAARCFRSQLIDLLLTPGCVGRLSWPLSRHASLLVSDIELLVTRLIRH